MEIFRIAREEYSKQLVASGRANRWNLDDQFMIYAGGSRSLASLELIVHKNAIVPVLKYKVMVISIADEEELLESLPITNLPDNWRSMMAYPGLQQMGSEWYIGKRSLALKVPSSIIPKEFNYIINTLHPYFTDPQKIALVRTEDYLWDDRLF